MKTNTKMKKKGESDTSGEGWARVAAAIAGIVFLFGLYRTLSPFLIPIAWTLVLAVLTWPVRRKISPLLGNNKTLLSFIMLTGVVLLVLLPATTLVLASKEESLKFYNAVKTTVKEGPAAVGDYPRLNQWMEKIGKTLPLTNVDFRNSLMEGVRSVTDYLIRLGQNVVENLFKLAVTLFILFFVYRDGDRILILLKKLLPVSGALGEDVINGIIQTVKAVLYGVVLTAVAQGLVAGAGFWILGFRSPILMGMATAVLAIVPYGSTLVWSLAALWLFYKGVIIKGLLVVALGTVIGTMDNLLRPLLISSTGKISALVVFLGIVGGVMAFGMIGLFIGPVILSVGLVLAEEYTGEEFR